MTTPHPTPQQLSHYLGGLLDAEARSALDAHLQGCVLCRAELSLLRELNLGTTQRESGFDETHTPEPRALSSSSSDDITTGFQVGRYIVTRRLGKGAMGLVFAAYDPRLDRNVALKLLRADVPMVENKPLRQRLEREAQALARLSHPNVVAVHDLGDFGDSLFIAMDLVEGETLTEWLRTPRTWRQVQEVFLMAGA
ncbi:MAG: protein kinase domain-containing protein, partial [Myxococcota bacterium]